MSFINDVMVIAEAVKYVIIGGATPNFTSTTATVNEDKAAWELTAICLLLNALKPAWVTNGVGIRVLAKTDVEVKYGWVSRKYVVQPPTDPAFAPAVEEYKKSLADLTRQQLIQRMNTLWASTPMAQKSIRELKQDLR